MTATPPDKLPGLDELSQQLTDEIEAAGPPFTAEELAELDELTQQIIDEPLPLDLDMP